MGNAVPSGGTMPPRPLVPPLLVGALSLWLACALVYSQAYAWSASLCFVVCVVGVLATLGSLAFLWRKQAVFVGSILVGLALGVSCAGAAAALHHTAKEQFPLATSSQRFEVVEDGNAGTFGSSCFARTTLPNGQSVLVRLLFDEKASTPRYGEVFEASVRLTVPEGSAATYCWQRGAVATGTVRSFTYYERTDLMGVLCTLRNRAVNAIIGTQVSPDSADYEGRTVLAALVCGWREGLDELEVSHSFKVVGLAHLVAVSGAHLSLVSAFAAGLLRVLKVPRVFALAIQAALLLGYLALAAAPVSALRAAVMSFAGMFSFSVHRRPAALPALGLCMAAFMVSTPEVSLSVSFALSALSTIGIVVFASLISAWVEGLFARVPHVVRDALALTCAASIMATPLSAALFSQIPLIAPLANVVVAPFFGPVCAGGIVATLAALAVPVAGEVLLSIAVAGAGFIAWLANLLARVPYASIPASFPLEGALVCSAVGAVALWFAWPPLRVRVAAAIGAAMAVVIVATVAVLPRFSGTEIIMLDVGQGDAFVIRSQGSAVLIDTGNQELMLREALARHGVYHLDAVLITHGDDDHCGALTSLSGIVQIDRVLIANDALSCACEACQSLVADATSLVGKSAVQGLYAGDTLRLGSFNVRVVWPRTFKDAGGNADSLCLVADADINADGERDWRALFVGDAEHEQLAELLAAHSVGEVDLYKVGHHGSKNALDDKTAAALSPRIALVSAGAGNRYGHPAEETLTRLNAIGATVLRTDTQGDVTCTFTSEAINVSVLQP